MAFEAGQGGSSWRGLRSALDRLRVRRGPAPHRGDRFQRADRLLHSAAFARPQIVEAGEVPAVTVRAVGRDAQDVSILIGGGGV
jgi:hypothetical protein